jgi:hypothetical protein
MDESAVREQHATKSAAERFTLATLEGRVRFVGSRSPPTLGVEHLIGTFAPVPVPAASNWKVSVLFPMR